MKQYEIKVGAVYRNAGKGQTQRKVLGVGADFRPTYVRGIYEDDDEIQHGVEFQQRDLLAVRFPGWRKPERIWLGKFAAWAGSEVNE